MEVINQIQRVVFQLSSDDSLVHKSLIKQLNNLMAAVPDIRIEIVSHGPGVEFLKKPSRLNNSIETLYRSGVVFLVCRNTLIQKDIKPEQLIPIVELVPSGIAHLVTRQSEGWSYIKSGF